MKIWTDDECIEVEPNDVGELESAMRFKAEHIKAKADPELFTAVADMLDDLWDVAIRRTDVVRCRECKHWEKGQFQAGDDVMHLEYGGYCPNSRFARYESDFCSYGERKEGDD